MSNVSRRQVGRTRGRGTPVRRRSPWALVGLGVLAVVIVAGALYLLLRPNPNDTVVLSNTAAPDQLGVIKTYTGLSRDHKAGTLSYAQNPPVGGAHNAVWENCGIYNETIKNENAVHSLEHGAVWITYRPDLPAADVAKLRAAASGHSYVLLSPYPGIPAPIALSAWGVQMLLDNASDPKLASFVQTYEQGAQTPEPGAACSGGIGTPSE